MRGFVSTSALAVLLAVSAAAGPARAQQQGQGVAIQPGQVGERTQPARPNQAIPVVALSDWRYDQLYQSGWRAEQLLDSDVFGPAGDEIGEVENIVVNPDGQIASLVVEVGGFLDIGDTHVSVPWSEVQASPTYDRVTVPVTKDNLDQYGLFRGTRVLGRQGIGEVTPVDDDVEVAGRFWKVTELIDDYVTLGGRVGYGYVEDLVFDPGGRVQAVIVDRDVTYGTGRYAFPYHGYGYGFDPGLDYYDMPYAENEVAGMEPFDYGLMD